MRDESGKFKKGSSGNPNGRPKHGHNFFAEAIAGRREDLVAKLIDLALDGDVPSLKICIDRLIPPLKAQGAPVSVDNIDGDLSLADQARALMTATVSGQIPPDTATQLINSLSALAKIIEVSELDERIRKLEERQNEK